MLLRASIIYIKHSKQNATATRPTQATEHIIFFVFFYRKRLWSTSWEASDDDIGIINKLNPMLIGLRVGFGLMVGWNVMDGEYVGDVVGYDVGASETDGDIEGSTDGWLLGYWLGISDGCVDGMENG